MKVLITGGAGFIGSAIIEHFQKLNYDIYVIDNLSFGNRSFINIDDEHFFNVDIRDQKKLALTVNKINPDWLIHLAAVHFIPYCNQNPIEASEINILGTLNVLKIAEKITSVKKVFFASTAAVYPISNEAVNENHSLNPLDIYGITKLSGEKFISEFTLRTGVPSIICRFFNAFGPNETNPHLIPEIQQQINSGRRTIKLGNIEPKRDFIHTHDMAEAVTLLMNKEITGCEIYNLGRGIEYSVKEVVEAFSKELNEKIQIEIDPSRVRKVERMHLLADISKLKKAINWEPKQSLENGIKTLINPS